jgi:hypothetical protein
MPRVSRKRLRSQAVFPRPNRKAESPERKMKVGAQIWVTQRVRNSAGSVTSRGLNPVLLKKSRVWSKAIMAITSPRRISTEAMRADLSETASVERTDQLASADPETLLRAIEDATVSTD